MLLDDPDSVVTPTTLGQYLTRLRRLWCDDGIAVQLRAFRQGLSDVCQLDGLLAFEAHELRDLVCGPNTIEWTEDSLRKLLRPQVQPGGGGLVDDEPTMVWLREILVEMPQTSRRSFVDFVTALPRLKPDTSIEVTLKHGCKIPTAHTCTKQLNLPRYNSKVQFYKFFLCVCFYESQKCSRLSFQQQVFETC